MRYYMGVDWADRSHAVVVVNDSAVPIASQAIEHTPTALSAWGRTLDSWRQDGVELWAAIERPHGLIVEFLLDHGVTVFPINPKALDRARDWFRPSGSKSDPFDARVLADFLRTDYGQLHALRPSSPAAQELKLLTEDFARLVRQQTRLLNQLTATLKAYYPLPLDVWPDLSTQIARDFLRTWLTPADAAALTRAQWARFARRHHLSQARCDRLWVSVHTPQVAVPATVVRAKARLARALLAQLDALRPALAEYETAIERVFLAVPTAEWARSLPASKSGTTVPTLWACLGDAPGRWSSWQHLQACAGTVPVTARSGKYVGVRFRFACDKHLRRAIDQFAFLTLRSSTWAAAYYRQQRARGHDHRRALRALSAKWLKIMYVLWTRNCAYDETHHLAEMTRQALHAPQTVTA